MCRYRFVRLVLLAGLFGCSRASEQTADPGPPAVPDSEPVQRMVTNSEW
jgi:hypothetical protein